MNQRLAWAAGTAMMMAVGGCSELVVEGRISDRETGSTIPDVEVLASASADNWKTLGHTDGRGAYWILKSKLQHGQIQFRKPGYFPAVMRESDFLGSGSHLMTPTGEGTDSLAPKLEPGTHDELIP
jgi:hypothetical protein